MKADIPPADEIIKTPQESQETFFNHLMRLNNLGESLKFLPSWEALAYGSATSDLVKPASEEYGYAMDINYDPWVVTEPGVAYKEEQVPLGNGETITLHTNGPYSSPEGKGMNPYSTGARHRVTVTKDKIELYWGMNGGSNIKKSFDFNPSAGEWYHFENMNSNEAEISSAFTEDDSINYDAIWDSDSLGSNPIIPEGITQLLNEFGDMNYYDITMSATGGLGNKFLHGVINKNEEMMYWNQAGYTDKLPANLYQNKTLEEFPFWGDFSYDDKDGVDGEGMLRRVALFLGMRESYNRFTSTMREVFGDENNLFKADGSKEMIKTYDQAMKGLSPRNQACYTIFLKFQHATRSAMGACMTSPEEKASELNYMNSGNGDTINNEGIVYSGRDGLCSDRFRWAIYNTVKEGGEFEKTLKTAEQIKQWRSFVTEVYDVKQPYMGELHTDYYPGWDTLCAEKDVGDKSKVKKEDILDLLPEEAKKDNYGHWEYTVAQIDGLNNGEIQGKSGTETGLFKTNWVLHALGSAMNAQDQQFGEVIGLRCVNRKFSRDAKKNNEELAQMKEDLFMAELQEKKAVAKRIAEQKKASQMAQRANQKFKAEMQTLSSSHQKDSSSQQKGMALALQRKKQDNQSSAKKNSQKAAA
ncbi:MAG: hypothetical protein NT099_00465 [Candidatus Saganbacteria bacterium]|nr:hypothetical protein [Candidatus Saganbacteria bacterium]